MNEKMLAANAVPSAAADRAEALFRGGYNCSQSVVLALCEGLGMPKELAARASLGLGGGIGRLREVCGAVSGMAFLAGLRHGSDAGDSESKKRTYRAVQQMAGEFRAEQGTLLCRDILGLVPGEAGGEPEPRTSAFYERRKKCIACIRLGAAIAERTLASAQPRSSEESSHP